MKQKKEIVKIPKEKKVKPPNEKKYVGFEVITFKNCEGKVYKLKYE
jgi:hypothetical protein